MPNFTKNLRNTILAFTATFMVLFLTGVIPEELAGYREEFFKYLSKEKSSEDLEDGGNTVSNDFYVQDNNLPEILPNRITISRINIDISVLNPESRDVSVLDKALLSGAVRYPGSPSLEDQGNMFIFGHSTSHQVVQNQSFKAFNRLDEMVIGDMIEIFGEKKKYTYSVFSVKLATKDDVLVDFSNGIFGEKMITLSTCDSFGKKDNRVVIEALLIDEADIL